MKRIVFFSWQSDSPNSTNRGFIQKALEKAAATIAADDAISVEPVIDRDTQGVAGSPDIAATIFAKISAADIVVADVTIIGRVGTRAVPNPNVLVELGYAYKAIGHERVILVFNTAFGRIEELPFDLRMRRLVSYHLPKGGEKTAERKMLEGTFEAAIRQALATLRSPEPPQALLQSLAAIEEVRPNRLLVLRRDLGALLTSIQTLAPPPFSQDGSVEKLLKAIDDSQEATADFSTIVRLVAALDDEKAAVEIHRWLGRLIERYNTVQGSGRFSRADFDFWKFLGHEFFVSNIGALLSERRWNILETLFHEPIPVPYMRDQNGPGMASWEDVSQFVVSLREEGQRCQRISLHADLLRSRHTTGGLASIMPLGDVTAADLFLFLRSELAPDRWDPERRFGWKPWSALWLASTPAFIQEAERVPSATRLAQVLGVASVGELKERLPRGRKLSRMFDAGDWDYPIHQTVIDRIASRP